MRNKRNYWYSIEGGRSLQHTESLTEVKDYMLKQGINKLGGGYGISYANGSVVASIGDFVMVNNKVKYLSDYFN